MDKWLANWTGDAKVLNSNPDGKKKNKFNF